jgi:small neutral amino acid transporter SnatA (MarC family)
MARRILLRTALGWLVVAAALRAVVLLPEQCPPVTPEALRTSAAEAVGWFERNQRADGRWLYRYDADAGRDLGGYNLTRHGGVTMSLYQAAIAGHEDALEVADAGAAWALDRLVELEGGLAFGPEGDIVPVGATGLLAAGLAERRALTGDPGHDDDLAALGRFLTAMVRPSGAVIAYWDLEAGAPLSEDPSPFFTGEVYWALGLLHRELPDQGFGAVAERVGRYLATERDEAERWFPDISDHWAAYGMATQAEWPDAAAEDPDLARSRRAYATRQAGIAGFQVRWESQRTGTAPNELVRGGPTLGAGLGTLGEQLAGLWRLAGTDAALADLRDPLAARAGCVAGMLVQRQVTADEAAAAPEPDRARGAWLQRGITQMDDQQHALSAVLYAEPIVASQPVQLDEPWGAEVPTALLLVALVLALDPIRAGAAARRSGGRGRPAPRLAVTASAASLAVVVVVLAGAAGGPLLDALDVSAPTLRIGAGLVLLITALVDLVRPAGPRDHDDTPDPGSGAGLSAAVVPVALPTMLRPAALVTALSAGADGGLGLVALGSVTAGFLVVALAWVTSSDADAPSATGAERLLSRWAVRLGAALLVVVAVALTADGVYDV